MSASLLSARVRGAVIVLAGLLMLPLAVPAAADVSDTISVIKEGETLDTVEIVSRLAEATFDGRRKRVRSSSFLSASGNADFKVL